MKKSQLMDLIESYHSEINAASLKAQLPYQKGWLKRLFDSRTQGILELETFLDAKTVHKLAAEEEIEGTNLIKLLAIMRNRDQRICRTSRSYENYPEKSTNRVYNRLYQLMLLDAAMQADIGIPFPQAKILQQTLFSRVANQVIAEREQRADNEKNPKKANASYLRLGLNLIFKNALSHRFSNNQRPAMAGLTHCIKTLRYANQSLQVEFYFLKGELHEARLLSAQIQCRQDTKTGLQCLNLASGRGDKNASLHLAAFYARRNNYRRVNLLLDPDKAAEFLSLASEQGSKLAARVIEEELSFGMVSVYNNKGFSLAG